MKLISDDIYFDGSNDKAYKLALKLDIIDLKLQLLLNKQQSIGDVK